MCCSFNQHFFKSLLTNIEIFALTQEFAARVSMVILGLLTVRTISASSRGQDGLKDIFPDSLQTICCTDPRKSCGTDVDGEEGAQHPQQDASHRVPCGAKGKGCKCSFTLVNLPPNWTLLRLKMGDAGWCFIQIIMSSVCSWGAALTQRSSWLLAPAVGLQPVLRRPPGTQQNHCSWTAFCYRQHEGVRPCEQNPFFLLPTASCSYNKNSCPPF